MKMLLSNRVVMIMLLGCASSLSSAEKLATLQTIFGKELYAVPALRAKAKNSEEKIAVQTKKSEQFVSLVQWGRKNGHSQDEIDDLERELESCQEEKKE